MSVFMYAVISWGQTMALVIVAGQMLHPLWKAIRQTTGENYGC